MIEENLVPVKLCHKCQRFLPKTSEYFRFIKKIRTFHSPCKECVAKRIKERKKDPSVRNYKKEQDRVWRLRNRDKRNASFRERYKNDLDFRSRRKATHLKHRLKPESKKQRQKYQKESPRSIFYVYKRNARTRGLGFHITFEEFMTLWQKPCFYCGNPIDTIGIDRIDNDKGYEISNLAPCCFKCNHAKSNMSLERFIGWLKQISERLNILTLGWTAVPSSATQQIASQGGVDAGS